jgi:hypothetical protein
MQTQLNKMLKRVHDKKERVIPNLFRNLGFTDDKKSMAFVLVIQHSQQHSLPRNLALNCFLRAAQVEVLKKIACSVREKGYLVIGKDESLPLTYPTFFIPVFPMDKIYQKFNPNVPN